MENVIQLYKKLPSHQLVYIIKGCKELLAHPQCPKRDSVKTTLKALRNIMIERQTKF